MGLLRRIAPGLVRTVDELTVTEKLYGTVIGLIIVTAVLLVMSIQTMRLHTGYRQLQTSSAQAATNVGRVNELIYAIVMESRGIYMSTDRKRVKQFSDELLKRNAELAGVMARWEATVRADDKEQFSGFKQRIAQFIDFRKELVRLAIEVSPAAARELGDNDANRALRTQLNDDIEALAIIYNERALDAAELGDQGRYASWYLLILGFGAMMVTVVENIPEGIVVKDARNLRYVFVNKAAEEMIGMSRSEIMGKTARELFSVEAAELIERRDGELMERKQQTETIVDTVDNPVRGRRTIAVRRLPVGGPDRESHLFVRSRTGPTRQTSRPEGEPAVNAADKATIVG
jgi:PAS domain S-box-containing protein